MNCIECGTSMKHEGWQKNAVRDTKFTLHSCPNKPCSRYGFTVSGAAVAVTSPVELAENAAIRAETDRQRVSRALVGAR